METGLVSAFSNREGLWEYLLVVQPDAQVCGKLAAEQEEFYLRYQHKVGNDGIPYLKLGVFHATEVMEETLIKWIQRICSLNKGFPVTLNNYSGFPDDHIFLRVQDPGPLRELSLQLKAIDHVISSNNCVPLKLASPLCLSVAAKLPAHIYSKAMPEYSGKVFHESFMVTELLLLKRLHQFDACRQVNIFRLYPPDTNSYHQVA